MKRTLLAGALLLAAGAALASTQTGTWTNGCQSGQTIKTLHGGQFACYTPAAGASTSSASPIIDLNSCENVDVMLFDDFDGDGVSCTVAWTIQGCPPQDLTTDGLRDAACNTLKGTAALNGDDTQTNLAPGFFRVIGGGAGANINSCRVVIHCALDAAH